MIEHGIWNTTADYWTHFLPPDLALYYYLVRHCRDYIKERDLRPTDGHSKNGAITGRGYLIPKTADFVMKCGIRKSYVADVDYLRMTDREFGMWGQRIAELMILRGEVNFPQFKLTKLTSRADQFAGTDLELNREPPRFRIEVKTERKQTPNLFVQSAERDHSVHETRAGEFRFSDIS